MIIERFKHGPEPIYARLKEKGRMAPDGLQYINSWVTEDLNGCYQVMAFENRELLDQWIAAWEDLADFQVIPVVTSAVAASKFS
jgi:hypothetical protein